MTLRLVTAGESHGPRLTAILEGIPAGLRIDSAFVDRVLERASARESAARVAGGAVCKLLLAECGIEVASGVLSVGPVIDPESPRSFAALQKVREDSPLRAMDASLEKEMIAAIDEAKRAG